MIDSAKETFSTATVSGRIEPPGRYQRAMETDIYDRTSGVVRIHRPESPCLVRCIHLDVHQVLNPSSQLGHAVAVRLLERTHLGRSDEGELLAVKVIESQALDHQRESLDRLRSVSPDPLDTVREFRPGEIHEVRHDVLLARMPVVDV